MFNFKESLSHYNYADKLVPVHIELLNLYLFSYYIITA
jgi:hypothetical protein